MSSPELTDAQERLLLDSSVERVINTSIEVLDSLLPGRFPTERDLEHASTASQDWQDDGQALKYLVVQLWNHHRSEVFARRLAAGSCRVRGE